MNCKKTRKNNNNINHQKITQKIQNFDHKHFWSYMKKPYGTMKVIKNNKIKKVPNYRYYLNQQLVEEPNLLNRLHSLYIPPAYTNVIIAKSPDYKVQAIGVDVKGRKQYIYHPKFIKRQLNKKYNNIVSLGDKIIKMEKDVKSKLQDIVNKGTILDTPNDLYPIIVNMLLKYHFRIGSQKYENDNNSYGITTLCKNHIKLLGNNKFCIEFTGKKGVQNKVEDTDSNMYNILNILLRESADNNHLFCYLRDGKQSIISSNQIKKYLKNTYGTYITPKMFRTWYANFHLLSYLKNINKNRPDLIGRQMTKKQINTLVKNSSKYVSDKLNNTPTISKKSYINPSILNKVLVNPSRFIDTIPNDKKNIHIFLKELMSKR
jgi:DNA topoisomerase-1